MKKTLGMVLGLGLIMSCVTQASTWVKEYPLVNKKGVTVAVARVSAEGNQYYLQIRSLPAIAPGYIGNVNMYIKGLSSVQVNQIRSTNFKWTLFANSPITITPVKTYNIIFTFANAKKDRFDVYDVGNWVLTADTSVTPDKFTILFSHVVPPQ